MWTDGRYHLQATKEMDDNWTLMKDGLVETPSQAEWLCTTLASGNVGVDPMLMSATAWASLADRLDSSGIQLVPVQDNLVDIAWDMDVASPQPGRPENTVFPLELQFTGRTWQDKVEEVRRNLVEKGASYGARREAWSLSWEWSLWEE